MEVNDRNVRLFQCTLLLFFVADCFHMKMYDSVIHDLLFPDIVVFFVSDHFTAYCNALSCNNVIVEQRGYD